MPIKPENKSLYPANWDETRSTILERADYCCEFCQARNYMSHPITESRVILTVAHLDHNPTNCDPNNLRALCQLCHNSYDSVHRAETRKITLGKKRVAKSAC